MECQVFQSKRLWLMQRKLSCAQKCCTPAARLGRRMAAHVGRSDGDVSHYDYTTSPHMTQSDPGDREPVGHRRPDPAATHDRGHRLWELQHV
jgi:hypothetical protein